MTDEELRILAWTLLGEAAGEGVAGMEAVAHVIRNRAESGRFPSNPAAVAIQSSRNVYQFSTWNGLGNGGNLPRARFPVGSDSFKKAMRIVGNVFGGKPGADPTRGATHYYSPKGMPGGAAPYWWNSEAPRGGKKIGGHIFAVKYDPKEAPTPKLRPGGQSPIDYFPTSASMEFMATGKPVRLPDIGSGKAAPVPARQSAKLQDQRFRTGAVQATGTNFIFDPVTGTLRPKTPSASDLVRAAGSAKKAQRQTVAGFSVPATGSMADVDRARKRETLAANQSYAGQDRAAPTVKRPVPHGGQTQFAQPNVSPKDEAARLPASGPLAATPLVQSGGFSRDALSRRIDGRIAAQRGVGTAPVAAPAAPLRVAPIPRDPIQRPRVAIPAPTTAPLRVVVYGDRPIVQQIAKSPVQALRDQGFSPATSYDRAIQQERERARENAGMGPDTRSDWFKEATGG